MSFESNMGPAVIEKTLDGRSAQKFKFSGHQTFVFRFGWLEKGVRGVNEHPDLFSREDALVLLGVGKNMVESIRYWCSVTQLLEPATQNVEGVSNGLSPTKIARNLLLDGEWDPFLEDDASLWLSRRSSDVRQSAQVVLAS